MNPEDFIKGMTPLAADVYLLHIRSRLAILGNQFNIMKKQEGGRWTVKRQLLHAEMNTLRNHKKIIEDYLHEHPGLPGSLQ